MRHGRMRSCSTVGQRSEEQELLFSKMATQRQPQDRGGWGSRCADAIGQMVRDACVPWRAEPTTSASPAGPGGLHCGRATGSAESKQAEGGRDARVWLLACAHAICVGGWRAVQVVQVARCGAGSCWPVRPLAKGEALPVPPAEAW